MGFLKFLIGSFLVTASLPAEEPAGWFPVEKVQKAQEQEEEKDPSIWVLFSKSLRGEKILVRVPEDPTYRYTEAGDLEIISERDGETFQLTVQQAGPVGAPVNDLLYQSEGKWIREHFVQTAHHFYHFKTVSLVADSESHREFISSFLIEKNS